MRLYTGRIYTSMKWVYNFVLLNLLFIVSCVPIFTIPLALTALFSVARDMISEDPGESTVVTVFVRGFIKNAVQSYMIAVSALIVSIFIYVDFQILRKLDTGVNALIALILCLVVFLSFIVLCHAFPIVAATKLKWPDLARISIRMPFFKPYRTIVGLMSVVAAFYISMRFPVLFVLCFFSVSACAVSWSVETKLKEIIDER